MKQGNSLNIDELAKSIQALSSEKVVQSLGDLLCAWKDDVSTVEELNSRVERYIGNIWIESGEIHNKIYGLWSTFRNEVILHIDGMTMNERLFCFGLFNRFDRAKTNQEKEQIYAKLQARK